jgi:hypothetical protein
MKHDNELHNVNSILFTKKDDASIAKMNNSIKNMQELLKSLSHGKKASLVDELIKDRR